MIWRGSFRNRYIEINKRTILFRLGLAALSNVIDDTFYYALFIIIVIVLIQ